MAGIDPTYLREIIMDHYQYPRNKELKHKEGALSRHMASESCIDDITVEADIQNGIIQDIGFDGVACTISTASTDILAELLRGKTLEEANAILKEYFAMIDQKAFDEDLLEEAVAFQTVGRQANRIKCATIGANAMQEIIDEAGKEKA
jgi:nitrogen fixation NifU-like protein